MATRDASLTSQSLTWSIAINVLALVAYAVSPHANEFPLALVGIQVVLVIQVVFPSSRLNLQTPLCPANIAQGFFWVQLVLVPNLFGYFGIQPGTLPRMPSDAAINWAIGIHIFAYVCYCVCFHYFDRSFDRPDRATEHAAPYGLIVPFLVLGVVGFFMAFGGVGEYVDYLSSPVMQKEREKEAATIATAGSSFLRPFLGFALVMAWSAWLGVRTRSIAVTATVTLLLGAVLVVVNFSYNRGSMLAPLLGVAAGYSVHVRRLSLLPLGAAGAVVLVAALVFASYRSSDNRISDLTARDVEETVSEADFVTFLQIYASGPQISGYLIEELDADTRILWGRTLIPSIVYPIPVLGKPFRPDSGVAIMNRLIYDDPEIVDQIIPYDGELFVNFHLPGVALGFGLLGWIIAFLQRRFTRAENAVESYAWFLLALWAVFPGSLPVVSQICVYFFWPIYIYLGVKFLQRAQFRLFGLDAVRASRNVRVAS